ncbi:class I SAM-dependent methyltransferase [Chlorogloeopsis fritschii PCC 9212]|uniref:SAM-dependent methyltransferase n=1 Tax=Chlorogloeopsis fritschii PCC 6912 TaxID=211165 RepID=A0A433NF81_CHLFR|nr:class I SAM-dependent methyltransferase [Chlorogloeopsis fritschii]RUR80812.1 SAM-dependent methyltransferase [Chlorogloeopsis fritschii PCC 6912]
MEVSSHSQDGIQLDRVVFFGRTLSEYTKFFDLDLSQWEGCKILDCPSGAASFVAEANNMGIHAVACDLLFNLDETVLFDKGKADFEHVVERVALVPQFYNWEFYGGLEGFKKYRKLAFQRFSQDYTIGKKAGRYIAAELPKLPFADQSFDLVLSGHFLFLYSDEFDYKFHLNSILELYRVCSQEVRIYPLQGKNAKLYPLLDNLISDLKSVGITTEIVKVNWEFQKGSNQMLHLIR